MAADIAIYDARKAALAVGRDALLPTEVSNAMLRGDSPLKALRKWRDMSQTELSRRGGYLSDLESGRHQGAPETLRVITEALNIDPAWDFAGRDFGSAFSLAAVMTGTIVTALSRSWVLLVNRAGSLSPQVDISMR